MRSAPYRVLFTPTAEEDLERLVEYLLVRAQDLDDLERAQATIGALRRTVLEQLATMPWSFRKAGTGQRATRRELIVPAGAAGYVVLYDIASESLVQVLAIRHQLEQDYH